MKKIAPLFQFLPLSIFLITSRSHGFTNEAWAFAFQAGAVAAIIEFAILLPLLGNRMNRLIAGANVFLLLGGSAFFFKLTSILVFISTFRETGIFICLIVTCLLAFVATPTGVFEDKLSKHGREKKYSLYFIGGIFLATIWSYLYKGNPLLAGTLPFVFLILLKQFLQRRLLAD